LHLYEVIFSVYNDRNLDFLSWTGEDTYNRRNITVRKYRITVRTRKVVQKFTVIVVYSLAQDLSLSVGKYDPFLCTIQEKKLFVWTVLFN
jgi:hypothetical protein